MFQVLVPVQDAVNDHPLVFRPVGLADIDSAALVVDAVAAAVGLVDSVLVAGVETVGAAAEVGYKEPVEVAVPAGEKPAVELEGLQGSVRESSLTRLDYL